MFLFSIEYRRLFDLAYLAIDTHADKTFTLNPDHDVKVFALLTPDQRCTNLQPRPLRQCQ